MIEHDLETLINAVEWTVDDEGITKTTYVYTEDATKGFTTRSYGTAVKIVIYPSTGSMLRGSGRYKIVLYEGDLIVYGSSITSLRTAESELQEIADTEPFLIFISNGILGHPLQTSYQLRVRYEWTKLE